MIPTPVRRMAAALLVLATTSSCSSSRQRTVESAPRPVSTAETQANAIARARADSIRHPYTEADVNFMTSMIGHHAQAVLISHLAPDRAQSPAVKRLAERIISGQQDEIRTMQQWLRDRLKPVPQPDLPGMTSMSSAGSHRDSSHRGMAHDSSHDAAHHSAHHPAPDSARQAPGHGSTHANGHSMPGMLSEQQIEQLRAARGDEFDRLFLTFMIQHHRGAVAMVERLFGTYGAAQNETVFKFASDVNVDQITEIARMERMLRSLFFESPAP